MAIKNGPTIVASAQEILVAPGDVFTRIGVVEEGKLVELYLEPQFESAPSLVGGVYVGRVHKIVSNINAAFVEFEKKKMGFLAARNVGSRSNQDPINKRVQEGMLLPIEVIKDARDKKNCQVKALSQEDFPKLIQGECLRSPPGMFERLLAQAADETTLTLHIQKSAETTQYTTIASAHHIPQKLYDEDPFEVFGVKEELTQLSSSSISLPTGGWITLEPTEALIAVDVNSGGNQQPKNANQSALETNLEAASAIAQQLRLRAIGGLIVIDFIHMEKAAHNKRLVQALLKALEPDPTPTQVGSISEFGTLTLTRKRSRDPVMRELWKEVRDYEPSLPNLAETLFEAACGKVSERPGNPITLSVSSALYAWIQSDGRGCFEALNDRLGGLLRLNERPDWPQTQYDVIFD